MHIIRLGHRCNEGKRVLAAQVRLCTSGCPWTILFQAPSCQFGRWCTWTLLSSSWTSSIWEALLLCKVWQLGSVDTYIDASWHHFRVVSSGCKLLAYCEKELFLGYTIGIYWLCADALLHKENQERHLYKSGKGFHMLHEINAKSIKTMQNQWESEKSQYRIACNRQKISDPTVNANRFRFRTFILALEIALGPWSKSFHVLRGTVGISILGLWNELRWIARLGVSWIYCETHSRLVARARVWTTGLMTGFDMFSLIEKAGLSRARRCEGLKSRWS